MIVMCVFLLTILCKQVFKRTCRSEANLSSRTREIMQIITSRIEKSDSNGEEFAHDRLVDEDVEYRSTYDYFEEEMLPDLNSSTY